MIDLGTVKPGSTIRIPFDSFAASTGASSAVSNYAVGDILVYKDGSTTERASTNGYTATTSFDSVTGINLAVIDLADNTTAGFWAAGSEYFVVISPITIDSQTVATVIGRFRIGIPGAVLDTTIATLSTQTSFTLTAGPAEDDALNGCVVYIHDVASAVQGGYAVVNDYTGSTKTVTLAAGTTFTAAATDNISIFHPANLQYIGGAALNTSSAQLGVNVVNAAGTAWGSGAITAASIASNAITSAKIATDAIGAAQIADNAIDAGAIASGAITSAKFAAGAIDATAIADNAIDAGAIATGAITSTKFAAGAIDATAIANGAIDAATFAADVDAEILSYIVDDATRIDASALNTASGTSIPAILDDTGTSGVVVASINNNAITAASIAANAIAASKIATGAITAAKFDTGAIDAAALATDAVQEIRDSVLNGTLAELTGDPGATPAVKDAVMLLYMALRNKRDTTASDDEIHNSAGSVVLTAAVSDDGTTFTKAKYA